MNLSQINSVYFLGIGGIGMSSLARYFKAHELRVEGYDRTSTKLTAELQKSGIQIHFTEDVEYVQITFVDKEKTLIIRTPAVPEDHAEYQYFTSQGFTVLKRAQVLGQLFNQHNGIAIAGTHGKTSVSTFTSYLLKEGGIDCTAFLGGISKNFNTNLLIGKSDFVVAEADEYDRSFLNLQPYLSLVTTVDADHLDIYNDFEDIRNTFTEFVSNTRKEGVIILNKKVHIDIPDVKQKYTYSLDDPQSDYYASDIEAVEGNYIFTFHTPVEQLDGFKLTIPGKTNIENCVAAMGIAHTVGVPLKKLREILPGLRGVERRFDIQYQDGKVTYIDDYAHHPREIDAVVGSLKDIYPGKRITGVFQPHLFSRTRDFAEDFAVSLSNLDELILLDIYPAREKPIPGVSSDMLFEKIQLEKKYRCSKENLLRMLKDSNIEVLLTIGAGDIDQFVVPIKQLLEERAEN